MAVQVDSGGNTVTLAKQEVISWLAGSGDPEHQRVIQANPEAFDDLVGVGFGFVYKESDRDGFVGAVRRYADAVQTVQGHLPAYLKVFGRATPGVPDNSLERWRKKLDPTEWITYTAIRNLFKDPRVVGAALTRLDALIAADGGQRGPDEWHAQMIGELVTAGIDPDRRRITEVLSAREFLARTVGSRKLPLDPGADKDFLTTIPDDRMPPVKHGALSHTIQWLIVKWQLSADALAGRSLGDVLERTARVLPDAENVGDQHHALWTTLADMSPRLGWRADASMPEGITFLTYRFFTHIADLERRIEADFLAELAGQRVPAYAFDEPVLLTQFK